LRLELKKIKKTVEPVPIDNALLEISCGNGKHTESQSGVEAETELDNVTHCPINKDGQPVKAHIF
jgi:hypothetical protein